MIGLDMDAGLPIRSLMPLAYRSRSAAESNTMFVSTIPKTLWMMLISLRPTQWMSSMYGSLRTGSRIPFCSTFLLT